MTWLGRNHQYRQVPVRFNFLQPFQHLEAIHTGHLKIKENQIIPVLAIEIGHLVWIHGGRNVGITAVTQHLFKQPDIRLLIIHHQDFCI